MDDGDLVLTVIVLIGLIVNLAIVVVDDWRHRSKPAETRKVAVGPGT
jgi:hypothetical protein